MSDHILHEGCEELEDEVRDQSFLCFFCRNSPYENLMVVRETNVGTSLPKCTKDRFFVYAFWQVYEDRFSPGNLNVDPRKRILLAEIKDNKVIVLRSGRDDNRVQKFLKELGSIMTRFKNLTGQTATMVIVGSLN